MDLASTFVGLIGTAYKTIKFIKNTLDNLKNAPNELQSLRDRVEDIESSLAELERKEVASLFHSEQDIKRINRLAERVGKCLSEIEVFMKGMLKNRKDGEKRVDKVMWLWKGKDIARLKGHLVDLEGTLHSTWDLVHSRSQIQQAEMLREVESKLVGMSSSFDMSFAALRIRQAPVASFSSGVPLRATQHREARRLRCLEDCTCRCHTTSSRELIPKTVSTYIGQIHASKRLMDDLHIAPLECNVQTCRRDRKISAKVTWYPPSWMPYLSWQIPLGRLSIYFSIRTPRLVSLAAPIWDAIWNESVDELKALLLAGEASVHDVNEFDRTPLKYACELWQRYRSEPSYEVIKFLVEAGADPDLAVGNSICLLATRLPL